MSGRTERRHQAHILHLHWRAAGRGCMESVAPMAKKYQTAHIIAPFRATVNLYFAHWCKIRGRLSHPLQHDKAPI